MKKYLVALAALFSMQWAIASVDLNTANAQQIETLNGIGPAKAKAIVDYRTKNGPFKTADDLLKIPGIKQGTLSKIRSDITLSGKPVAVAAAQPAKPTTVKPKP